MKLGQSRYTTAGVGWHISPPSMGSGSQASEEPNPLPGPREVGWAALDPTVRQSLRQSLFQFRTLLSKRDSLRLIRVYEDVIGDMHPLLDTDRLAEQAEGWYNWPAAGSSDAKDGDNALLEDQSLLVLNLVLCIALCAEAGCRSETARGLYRSCLNMIGTMLAAPVNGLQHVVLVMLVVSFSISLSSFVPVFSLLYPFHSPLSPKGGGSGGPWDLSSSTVLVGTDWLWLIF
jgi:hypothetical protein